MRQRHVHVLGYMEFMVGHLPSMPETWVRLVASQKQTSKQTNKQKTELEYIVGIFGILGKKILFHI